MPRLALKGFRGCVQASNRLYLENGSLARDKDGIACEKR
jgi:hypothetical protein